MSAGLAGFPVADVAAATLGFWRGAARPLAPLPAPAPQLSYREVPGGSTHPAVPVVVVDPHPAATGKPALLHFHGGGFVTGRMDGYPPHLQRIARETGYVVVSPAYRLAPEHPFPAALDDGYAVLGWLHRGAGALGIDPARIALGGTSAGAGHAAMVAVAARDRGEYPVSFLLLDQPMLDDRTGSVRSMPSHLGRHVWSAASNVYGWSSHLGRPAGSARVPRGAVPARVDDLTGLPPTWIGVGSLDLFLVEALEWAARLAVAGVPVESHVITGAFHGFTALAPRSRLAREFEVSYLTALAGVAEL